ncbi:Hypothetical protein POVN_LOCUS133 [uncultured virus]|nr:Hypothetical protein POVN_LOCUS133 [uncultured virus]
MDCSAYEFWLIVVIVLLAVVCIWFYTYWAGTAVPRTDHNTAIDRNATESALKDKGPRNNQDGRDPHTSQAVVLNCMDFRIVDPISDFMNAKGYETDYDQLVIAGASLGVNQTVLPNWGETFWEHVELAKEIHKVEEAFIIDHQDCGAYKAFFDVTPENELELHTIQMRELYREFKRRQPDLKVYGYFIYISGDVIAIDLEAVEKPSAAAIASVREIDENNAFAQLRQTGSSDDQWVTRAKGDKANVQLMKSKLPLQIRKHIGVHQAKCGCASFRKK